MTRREVLHGQVAESISALEAQDREIEIIQAELSNIENEILRLS